MLVAVLAHGAEDFAAAVYRSPGVDKSADHRMEPLAQGRGHQRFAAFPCSDLPDRAGAELGRTRVWIDGQPFLLAAT